MHLPLEQQSPLRHTTESDKTKILYICPHAMYICDAGDVAPYYTSEFVVNESILNEFYVETHNELQWKDQERDATDILGIDVNNVHVVNNSSSSNDSDGNGSSNSNKTSKPASRWRTRAEELHKHLSQHHVILILSLVTSNVFREHLLLLLFHSFVHARSVIVLSDIVAESIGCGVHDGVIIHASPHYFCIGRVSDGNTVKYGNSKQGGALIASLMPTNINECKANCDCDVGNHKAQDHIESGNVISEELYRSIETHDEIIKLFGYTSYIYAIERHLQRLKEAQSTSYLTSIRALFEQTKAKMFSKDVHTHTGTLQRLFTQITENVSSSDIIICGHAASFQFIHDLCNSLALYCNKEVIHTSSSFTNKQIIANSSLARTHKRKRERSEHIHENNNYKKLVDKQSKVHEDESVSAVSAATHHITDVDVEESEGSETNDDEHQEETAQNGRAMQNHTTIEKTVQKKCDDAREKEKKEEEEDECHTSESSCDAETTESESSVSDTDGSNSSWATDDTDNSSNSSTFSFNSSNENCASELHLQPLPFCTKYNYKIEWLPLLGGSLLSEMSSHDLKRLRISLSEVSESNGAIIH